MMKDELLKRRRSLETDYKSGIWLEEETCRDISALCDLVESAVPAIDLLEARLERGNYLKKLDGEWWLFVKNGEGVVNGKTLRDILISLIFLDC